MVEDGVGRGKARHDLLLHALVMRWSSGEVRTKRRFPAGRRREAAIECPLVKKSAKKIVRFMNIFLSELFFGSCSAYWSASTPDVVLKRQRGIAMCGPHSRRHIISVMISIDLFFR